MPSDEEYAEEPARRLNKRQRLMRQITNLKCSNKQLTGKGKSDALFAIPPCEIKEPDFRLRFGLVKICNETPPYDRFHEIEIPDPTLRVIAYLVTSDVAYSAAFQGDDSLESQIQPMQDRMVRNLGRFTKPPTQEIVYSKKPAATKEATSKKGFLLTYADGANVEEHAVMPRDTSDSSSSEDQEETYIRPQYASLASPKQASDALLYVFKSRHTLRGLRLKVVKDWKTKAGTKNLFQPAMYAINEFRETKAHPKEYRPPVYVMAEDKNQWYYAILEIDGFVQVKNQKIVPQSLECFPATEAPVNAKKFTASATREEILEQFEKWKRDMSLEDMNIPDGLHPVGRFFYKLQQDYEMPSISANRPLGTGAKRYLDGMLKVLVGHGVTEWGPSDAVCAWRARNLEDRAASACGLPDSLRTLVHDSGSGEASKH